MPGYLLVKVLHTLVKIPFLVPFYLQLRKMVLTIAGISLSSLVGNTLLSLSGHANRSLISQTPCLTIFLGVTDNFLNHPLYEPICRFQLDNYVTSTMATHRYTPGTSQKIW